MNSVRTALAALAVLLALSPAARSAPLGLLNTVEFRAESLAALPQWQRVLEQIDREREIYLACLQESAACPSRAVMAWQGMIRKQIDRSRMDQIRSVNRFLNGWRYRADMRNWGQRDYWATPLQFLRHSGDCEDYAIAKYVSLRQLGFAADQLRVVVLRDTMRELAHAVLAVYHEDEVYILDNLSRGVLRQADLPHYVPYYSINETTRWAHVAPSATVVAAGEQTAPSGPSSARATR